ncbi:hypothetical protein Tco_1226355 [Tanacetum coccineum]
MTEQQTIKYAPQWTYMTVDNMIFQTNNVVGNFNYPPNVPTYKPIMNFLQNCPLYNAFTNCPSMVYQNFLREFWSTALAFDPFTSTDEPEKLPLKEFLIKFSVSNGQRPLTFDFKIFCSSTVLDYNNDKNVDHPTPKVLGENYSSTEQVNSIQQLLAYSLITRTEDPSKVTDIELTAHVIAINNRRDAVSPPPLVAKPKKGKSQTVALTFPKSSGLRLQGLSKKRKKAMSKRPPTTTKESPPKPTEGSDTGLPSTLDEGTRQSKPLPEGTATHPKDSGGNKQPLDKDITSTTSNEGTAKTTPHPEGDEEKVLATGEDMNEDPQDDKEVRTPLLKQDQPELSHVLESASDSSSPDLKKFDNILPLAERQLIKYLRKMSRVLFNRITEKQWEQHEESAVLYADLKASVDQYYDENIAHRDQTDKLMEASMSSLDRSSTTISDLYKGLNVITELLKDISNAVKDDPAINQKLNEATETFAKISSNVTEDTSKIKSMMTEMYAAFQGHPSLAPSGSVTPTLALTDIQANVEGENANTTTTEEPPSHTEWETEEPRLEILISSIPSTIDKGKGIATESDDYPSKKLVKASSIVRPDPDELVRVEFIINERTVYLTKQEIQDYWDKEEQIKKAEEEARLNAISKPDVIKVVREEAKKLGIHPKEAITTKVGELFKKAQDVEHEVLKKQHTKKVRKSLKLRKHKIHSALPVPEQTPSQVSGRKQKHMKLEPETRIPGLECNRALPENVPFVNNMVIKEPEYGIFFTDEFGDQAFQRWSDIDKVGMEALVSYLVDAPMVKSTENARFNMKLRKLIADHLDQEKLKSKTVKLEALGYKMN